MRIKTGPTECRRCGFCCRRYQACVRPEEVQRIIAFLGITPEEWAGRYDDPRWAFDDYRLIRHVKGACAFLKDEQGQAVCTIHAVRPTCCAEWQPSPERKECREGMSPKSIKAPLP